MLGESPRDDGGFELVASADEVRRMDHAAIADYGVEGVVLMELAGAAAARAIRLRLGGLAAKAVVLCGAGNNGGDGYVVARHLAMMGFAVKTLALAEPRPGTDAEKNRQIWQRLLDHDTTSATPRHEHRLAERGATARMRHFLGHANVIVDALFGTGLARPLDGAALELVAMANEAQHGLKVAL
ncbi:MAG TPA: NAD(P)H-hydrate epimerase, partial [Myxococcota bacterium]|nr:NAD(P)H-hydrate epimerase [Myxococcota bacterium]